MILELVVKRDLKFVKQNSIDLRITYVVIYSKAIKSETRSLRLNLLKRPGKLFVSSPSMACVTESKISIRSDLLNILCCTHARGKEVRFASRVWNSLKSIVLSSILFLPLLPVSSVSSGNPRDFACEKSYRG